MYAVAAGGGNIYFGGNFTLVTGTPHSFLAAVQRQRWCATPAVYSGINGTVLDLFVAR